MEGESGTLMAYVDQAIDFMRAGFERVNKTQGLIVALIAALLLPRYNRILVIALGATVAHVVIDIMLPVIARGQAFQLPPDLFQETFWRNILFLFLGYLIVISIFFAAKRLFLSR